MGRSQETQGKKEVKSRKDKKRKQKAEKKAIKKIEGKKNNFDDMIAYVDEFGVISNTPPVPGQRSTVDAGSIELSASRRDTEGAPEYLRKGIVTFFNDSKGFGFIRDLESKQSVFVHSSNLLEKIQENNIVVFEKGKGPKGPTALKVSLFKETTPST